MNDSDQEPSIWELSAGELPTVSILFIATCIFVAVTWLSFGIRRYHHLRSACLAASFLPFIATLASGIFTLTHRSSLPLGGSGIFSVESIWRHWIRVAIFLTEVGAAVSTVCLFIAIIALLLSRPLNIQSNDRNT